MKWFVAFLFVVLMPTSSPAEIILSTIAQVKQHVITSRELDIHQQLNKALGETIKFSDDNQAVESVIRQWLLFYEASTFYNNQVSSTEVAEQVKKAQNELVGKSQWLRLDVSAKELSEILSRRLEAERLYSFKKKASVLPVTTAELETEYTQNRILYGNQAFEEVKEKIREARMNENMATRMEQWFAVLETKYHVQRFATLTETQ